MRAFLFLGWVRLWVRIRSTFIYIPRKLGAHPVHYPPLILWAGRESFYNCRRDLFPMPI